MRRMLRAAFLSGVVCSILYYVIIFRHDDFTGMRLAQVHVVVRHGARAPIKTPATYLPLVVYDDVMMRHPPHTHVAYRLVTDDDDDVTALDDDRQIRGRDSPFFGQLTARGAQELYEVGTGLRRRYGRLVGAADDVIIRSTKIQRTVDSVRCLLAGKWCL